jgi:carbonic anhydrase/acetyltransferase-like protein (isoleucine patch superfamily)
LIEAYDGILPDIHPEAWAHRGAYLIGDVTLARGASAWPTTVLRGDMGPIRIGEDSNIQDGTICHDTTRWSETWVGARCTVGHRVILHGCRISDDVLVGMGAILMDNVEIGSNCLIAAGTLLSPGKVIPEGSVVMGSPGRIVREVGPREMKMIADGWKSYAAKVAKWLSQAQQ